VWPLMMGDWSSTPIFILVIVYSCLVSERADGEHFQRNARI
jgi:hypothetical protein